MALITKHIMKACTRSTALVIHFIVGGAAVLVAKPGARWSASVYRGEWAYCMHSETFIGSSFTVIVST